MYSLTRYTHCVPCVVSIFRSKRNVVTVRGLSRHFDESLFCWYPWIPAEPLNASTLASARQDAVHTRKSRSACSAECSARPRRARPSGCEAGPPAHLAAASAQVRPSLNDCKFKLAIFPPTLKQQRDWTCNFPAYCKFNHVQSQCCLGAAQKMQA